MKNSKKKMYVKDSNGKIVPICPNCVKIKYSKPNAAEVIKRRGDTISGKFFGPIRWYKV